MAGIEFPEGMPFPEQLVEVQRLMAEDDERARKIYETIGVYLGYAIAHYAQFYEIDKLMIMGRVTSGRGGDVIIERASETLGQIAPELAEKVELVVPDEKQKRHGQAVAAASLPACPGS